MDEETNSYIVSEIVQGAIVFALDRVVPRHLSESHEYRGRK